MIAAIYARKSTDQNVADEEKSVTRQVERARAYAVRKGWAVAEDHVYTDDGISGAEFVKRPGLLRLLNAVERQSPFQVLIMSEESRLGRESIETGWTLKKIIDAGVRVFYYLEDRERTLDTAIEKVMMHLSTFAAEMEREKAVQRTRDAMRRKAERGHVAGGIVYGYANQRVGDHVERVIVPSQAEVIRGIFQAVAGGDGFCRIAKRLNAEGIPSQTRRGWAISGVRELVMRDLYRGHQVYGKTRWERRNGTKRKIQLPESEWLKVDVASLRIVDEALRAAAHRRLAETRAVYGRLGNGHLVGRPEGHVETPYLLTGFLRCAICGGSVQAAKQPSRGTVLHYYRCATHRERGETCCPTGVRARQERLEVAILETIERDVLAEDILVAVVERTIARHVALAMQSEGRKAVIAGELAEVRVRIGRYVQALGDGVAIEEIRAQLSTCKLREQALLGELARLSPLTAAGLDRVKLRRRLEEWHGLLRQSSQIARQLLRKLLSEPIVLAPTPEGVRFRGRAAWGVVVAGMMQEVGLVVPPEGFARLAQQEISILIAA